MVIGDQSVFECCIPLLERWCQFVLQATERTHERAIASVTVLRRRKCRVILIVDCVDRAKQ